MSTLKDLFNIRSRWLPRTQGAPVEGNSSSSNSPRLITLVEKEPPRTTREAEGSQEGVAPGLAEGEPPWSISSMFLATNRSISINRGLAVVEYKDLLQCLHPCLSLISIWHPTRCLSSLRCRSPCHKWSEQLLSKCLPKTGQCTLTLRQSNASSSIRVSF